jgi:hypothetical protein
MPKNRWVLDEVRRAKKRGIPVDIDGRKYDFEKIDVNAMVLEKDSYMLDYEGDALGHIIALHIDSVEPYEKPSYKSMRCTKK